MKITTTFVCGDCGKKVEGKGILALRSDPGHPPIRKLICPKCQYGTQPVSKRLLNHGG